MGPLSPPREMFYRQEASGPQPLTYGDDGSVTGHLALWETCHSGFQGGTYSECVRAPQSTTDYKMFHLGQMKTAEGDMVAVGKLTYNTNHAPLTSDIQAASSHYDHTGSVGAFVRATNGRHGIWLSGVVRSDLSPEGLRDLRANPPSGDWRSLNGRLELVAALAVVVPGFPIPRAQLALAASGGTVDSLILPAVTEEEAYEPDRRSRAFIRERNLIAASIRV